MSGPNGAPPAPVSRGAGAEDAPAAAVPAFEAMPVGAAAAATAPPGGAAPPGSVPADAAPPDAAPAGAAPPAATPPGDGAPPGPRPGMSPAARRTLLAAPLALAAAGGIGFWAMLRGMGQGTYDPRGVPSALIGRPAPDFALPAVEGTELPPLSSADLRAPGRAVLVNVWASWCAPCVIEHPELMALARQGVPILGISYKDRPADAVRFLRQRGNPFARLGGDADGRVAIDWGVYGVPETFLLDRRGIVRWRWAGPVTPDVVAADLRPLLARHA